MTNLLFWLSYSSGDGLQVILIRATSLSEAKVKVELNNKSIRFVDGRKLDDLFASHIPVGAIGIFMDMVAAKRLLREVDKSPV